MAVAPAPVVPSPGKLPGISVSDAFGLPDNWTLAESLKGMKATGTEKIEPEPEKGEGTPDPDEMDQQKAAEKEKTEAGTTVAADKKAADEAAAKAREKTEAAAATPPKGAAAKGKPEPTAKPGAAKPAAAAPVAEPKKIKVGDKEYTEEELKKRLEQPAAPAAAAPKTEPAKPAPVAKKEPTDAEKQAESEKTQKIESEWIAGAAKTLAPAPVDEATIEKILTGGKEGVAEFDRIRREDMARTVLAVRKDLDQLYRPFFEAVTHLQSQNAASEDQRVWTEFTTTHPELANYEQVVKQHAAALVEADPAGVQAMSQADFNAKVAELTVGYIRQFNPDFGKTAPAGGAPAADPAAVTAAAKTLAAAKPAAGAVDPAKRKTPAAPAGTLPAGASGGGGKGANSDFQKSAVASLM